MVQVYADSALVYDSRLEDYRLLGLTVTTGVNVGGAAEITMPPNHPAYNAFTSYRTVVTIYKDGVLAFRGRALYPTDDFYKRRTITCEGERCFLRDGIIRPYLYQDDPAVIFTHAIGLYNAQVDDFKQFAVGSITVTDPNNYVRMESSSAETFQDFIDKLVERCGGYIVFTTNTSGQRVINWLAELSYRSSQTIEFGENLLDFTRSGASPDMATVIVPYGAQKEDGTRIDITSVTEDGADFIQDDDAVAIRGVIAKTMTWDDVTEPANLLAKAQQALTVSKMAITSLQLSAADLSRLGTGLDTFAVGDLIHVISRPHNVDDWFQLMERTEDMLDPAGGSISLGKDHASLVGADVAGDRESISALQHVKHEITANYQNGIAAAIQEATLTLSSLIQQTSESIMLEVSESYARGDDVESLISSRITQLADSINFEFTQLQAVVDANDAEAREQFETIHKYIRFDGGDIVLGEAGNEITLRIENDRISFLDGGAEVAYFSNKQLVVTDANILNSLRIGRFAWLPRANGNLSLVKVGD